jgi:hypothetical protein
MAQCIYHNFNWKRAEAVEGPSPRGVWGGNGRDLAGLKGPYRLKGPHECVSSSAGPRSGCELGLPLSGFSRGPEAETAAEWRAPSWWRGVLAGVPGRPKAAAAAGCIGAAPQAQSAPISAVDDVFIMDASERARSLQVSVHAHWHRQALYRPPAF